MYSKKFLNSIIKLNTIPVIFKDYENETLKKVERLVFVQQLSVAVLCA